MYFIQPVIMNKMEKDQINFLDSHFSIFIKQFTFQTTLLEQQLLKYNKQINENEKYIQRINQA